METFSTYELKDPLFNIIMNKSRMGSVEIIEKWLDIYFKLTRRDRNYEGMEAEIVKRKIDHIFLGLEYKESFPFDIMNYDRRSDIFKTYHFVSRYETYILNSLHEKAGISLEEYKKLTLPEKEIILTCVDYKNRVEEIINEVVEEYSKKDEK